MILDAETKRKMRDMGAAELVDAIELQDGEGMYESLAFGERLQIAVDSAHSSFVEARVCGLIKRANLRFGQADVRKVALMEERGLDRTSLLELSTCAFVGTRRNVIFHGMTGSGKSYLACALLKEACRRRLRCYYVRVPDLEDKWRCSREKDQGELKLLKKLSAYDCLCLDEWLLDPPDERFRSFLFELMERRYDAAPTVFCTQYPMKDWHHRLGGGVHADAIMDRIVHGATWFYSGDVNMRERMNGADGRE